MKTIKISNRINKKTITMQIDDNGWHAAGKDIGMARWGVLWSSVECIIVNAQIDARYKNAGYLGF